MWGLVAGQAQCFGLVGSDEQIHHLNLLGLAFCVSLNVGAGGEDLDVLEQGFHSRSQGVIFPRRVAGDEDVDVHTWGDKSGHADDFVNPDRCGSHAGRDG